MKHQLCRLCGHRHRLGDPCIFDDPAVGDPVLGKRSPEGEARADKAKAREPAATTVKERFKKGGSEARLYRSIGLPPSTSCLNDPDKVSFKAIEGK